MTLVHDAVRQKKPSVDVIHVVLLKARQIKNAIEKACKEGIKQNMRSMLRKKKRL